MASTTSAKKRNGNTDLVTHSRSVTGIRSSRTSRIVLVIVCVAATLWSLSGAAQLDVWAFELIPGLIGICGVIVLSRWFVYSGCVHAAMVVAFVLIATGARYTYAAVPVADWIGEWVGAERNHFDRLGHFIQGLTVGLMTREVLVRQTTLRRSFGIPFLTVAVALAFSAVYELVEWWVVLQFYPEHGPAWLGMQGDPWDAQQDMAMALCGSLTAALVTCRLHDASIRRTATGAGDRLLLLPRGTRVADGPADRRTRSGEQR